MNTINELLKKVDILPASPALLPKLTQVLANIENADIYEVVDLIMYDASLTAKLLQIANSAYFGNRNPVTTVGEAISHLGFDTVYLLAASITGENCLRAPPGTGLDAVLLWRHSVITAFSAQHVARAAGLDGNLMFTAGLLHDVGKAVFAEVFGKDYTRMFDPAKRESLSLAEWENKTYGYDHAKVGAALLERWKLSPAIVAAVRFHHQLPDAGENAPAAACVCLGNALSRTLEQPAFALDAANPEIPLALQRVTLTQQDLAGQWNAIRQNWEFVQRLCELRKEKTSL